MGVNIHDFVNSNGIKTTKNIVENMPDDAVFYNSESEKYINSSNLIFSNESGWYVEPTIVDEESLLKINDAIEYIQYHKIIDECGSIELAQGKLIILNKADEMYIKISEALEYFLLA